MARIEPVYASMKTELLIDALYFHTARRSHEEAVEAQVEIGSAHKNWMLLDREWKRIEETIDDPSDQYDLLEPLCPQLDGADYQIGKAYGSMIKAIAIVHILSCATMEAHINIIAKESLKTKEYSHFERLSLETKWLFLPKLIGFPPFDTGRQPFQGFSRLIQLRNKLVHYKGMQEEWISGKPPGFLDDIGLSLPDSEKAIETVTDMISALAVKRKVEPPYWLKADLNEIDYFKVDVVRKGSS